MIKNTAGSKLSRTGAHRKSMLNNMASSLLMHEEIRTTAAKAKEIKRVVERIITHARKGNHCIVRKAIQNKTAYNKLFDVLAPRYSARAGGYTRIYKIGTRKGDAAEMTLVKLVE